MRSDPEQSPRFASCKQKFKGFFSGFFNRARTIFSNHMAKYQQITPAPPIEFRMKFGSSVVEALKKSSARNSNENIRFSDDRKCPQKNQNKSFLTNLKKLEEKVGSLGLSVCLSVFLLFWLAGKKIQNLIDILVISKLNSFVWMDGLWCHLPAFCTREKLFLPTTTSSC